MNNVFIDVTILEPRMKHPTIFEAFDHITEGGRVVIHNDHDPKPLYYQLLGERGNCFTWTYLTNGPEIWEVEIKKNKSDVETVGEIAAKDIRKAEVFKKMGIDFCCGGKRTLEEVCAEKGLDVIRVKRELEEAPETNTGTQLDFNSFSLSFLSDYIVNVHHGFVNTNLPLIGELSEKVVGHHGISHPFLIDVFNKINELGRELTTHMKKEEQILFPAIKLLDNGNKEQIRFGAIGNPIRVMEKEHDIAGDIMKDIRKLTADYTLPPQACNSMGLLFQKLEAFEGDLFQHIHLENNILFPKAIALEQER